MTDKIDNTGKRLRFAWWGLAIIVLSLVILIRIRLLDIPLERDEGEYAYAGQLLLQGIPPYQLAYNMKFPGTYAAYAVIMSIFGQSIGGIHLGLLVVNVATVALIFLLGRRLLSSTAGIVAAVSYGVLSASPSVLGLAAHATHFVMLAVLGGTSLLQRILQSKRPAFAPLFTSGTLFGVAVLMKQPALSFIAFGGIYLLWNDVRRGFRLKEIILRNLTFAIGAMMPFVISCLILWHSGVFDKFWFWTIRYAAQYAGVVPLSRAPQIFAVSSEPVIKAGWTLWALAGFGIVAGLWCRETRASAGVLLGLLASAALALCAGFYFREHYFILILPALSLLAGLAIEKLTRALQLHFTANHTQSAGAASLRFVPLLFFVVALVVPVFSAKKFFFEASPVEACRMAYGWNPFPESVRIAEYLKAHSRPDDTIAVLGSEPQIYFYAQRHSATGYIYTYALMEPQKYAKQMQEEMIREIERARPKHLISVVIDTSWLQRSGSERLLFKWADDYTARNYTPVGLVNIIGPDQTDYYLGDMPRSVPELGKYILIYERKS